MLRLLSACCYIPLLDLIVTVLVQIMEELESLEETLNESIRESLGARAGKVAHGRKKGSIEDEDDILR